MIVPRYVTQPFASPVWCYDGWWMLDCEGGASMAFAPKASPLDGAPFVDRATD